MHSYAQSKIAKIRAKRRQIVHRFGEEVITERDGDGKLVINHKPLAHQMVRYINMVPLHRTIKRIMELRLLGAEENAYKPMTLGQVAIYMAMTVFEVERLENEGKYIVAEHMRRLDINTAEEKIKREPIKDGIVSKIIK